MTRRLLTAALAAALATVPSTGMAATAIPDMGLRIMSGPSGDLCKEARLARDAGVPWVTIGMSWAALEATPDANRDATSASAQNLRNFTAFAQCTKALGLGVMMNVSGPPTWASGTTAEAAHPLPDKVPAYGEFLAELAGVLGPYVDVWVPWNEPNFDLQWAPPHDAALYVKIQKAAYTAIKSKDPTALVSSAPIVGTATTSATPAWDYLAQMYANGIKGYADIIGYNFYPRQAPEAVVYDTRGRPATWALSSQTYLRQLVDKYDPGRPIWIQETGHSTCVRCNASAPNALSESQQADYLVRMYTYRRRYLQGVTDKIFWYNERDLDDDPTDWYGTAGLLRYDWSPKPAWNALGELRVTVPDPQPGTAPGLVIPAPGDTTSGTGGGSDPTAALLPTLPAAAAKPPLPPSATTSTGIKASLGTPRFSVSKGVLTVTVTAGVSSGRGLLQLQGYRGNRWRTAKTVRFPGAVKVTLRIADKGYLGLRLRMRPVGINRFVVSRVIKVPRVVRAKAR